MSIDHYPFFHYLSSQLLCVWAPPIVGHVDFCICESAMKLKSCDWRSMMRSYWSWDDPLVRTLRQRFPSFDDFTSLWLRHVDKARNAGARIIPYGDTHYPAHLYDLNDPPLALNCIGDQIARLNNSLAIVGSRKANGYALFESFRLAQSLAMQGVCVVSGGAFGCDYAAHQGALAGSAASAMTCVILPSGLGVPTPSRNVGLFKKIVGGGGMIVSERLWLEPAKKYHYRIRNRIVSGATCGVAIMQAGYRSGATVTAKLALDQGRDVFVLVHDSDDCRAAGSIELLRDGANGFENSQSFIEKCFLDH